MLLNKPVAIAVAALAASSQAAPVEERQSSSSNFALSLGGNGFDINYLQTFALSYANSSAYIGEIKYQAYAEPLIVGGAGVGGAGDGLGFLSIHQTPTGYQEMYVTPHVSAPVGFSVPHGSAPQGVRTTGFSFDNLGNLRNNGMKRFWACQDSDQAAINTFQIWWFGAGYPSGLKCQGPISIKQSDACARGA